MEDTKEKICRLCLDFEDNNFTKLEASTIGKVKAIIPELTLTLPSNTLICSKCTNVLDKSFELKRTLSKNNDLILNAKEKAPSKNIDLNSIVENGNPQSGEEICRICLKRNGGEHTYINQENDNDFDSVLGYCVPELDVNLTTNPAVCATCKDTLCEMYNFKKDCLSVDEKIQSCYSTNSEEIDLNKVLMLTRIDEENDFLSGFEVQDEEGTDIFDNIPNAETDSRKRPLNESGQEDVPFKKQKLLPEEIMNEELPYFSFNANLLYNPNKTDVMVEDWLADVELYKQKFGWSDYTTIHKVLVQLKGMKELYIWFSNIADIMDWANWKKKLIRAFPLKNDYNILLKKMMIRKKRKEETYISYYFDKLKLMEPLNLTPDQQVSCIFGGVTEVLVCCVGRVGDYKKPEEILDYFKSCDDKQSVEAAAKANEAKSKPAFRNEKPKPANGAQQSAPAYQNSPDGKKRIRIKCYDCHRYGHTANECRQYHIGQHLDRIDKVQQNNPRSGQPHARPPKKNMLHVKCLYCGNMGHMRANCPQRQIDNPGTSNALQQKQGPQEKQSPKNPKEEKCFSCHQTGHTICNCFNELSKKLDGHKNTTSQQKLCRNCGKYGTRKNPCCAAKQSPNKMPQLCRNCGKYGSRKNPCCTAMAFINGTYIGSYSQGSAFNKQICLRCYKTGHATQNCNTFANRSFRN